MITCTMKQPYFFCGQDLSDQQSASAFVVKLLKKVEKKTGVTINSGVSAKAWDNSHAMYVIAQLQVSNPTKEGCLADVHAIEKWFWDPKNQMLKFSKPKKTNIQI